MYYFDLPVRFTDDYVTIVCHNCVSQVDPKSIEIHWVCRGYSKVDDPANKLEPPPRVLNSEQIKR